MPDWLALAVKCRYWSILSQHDIDTLSELLYMATGDMSLPQWVKSRGVLYYKYVRAIANPRTHRSSTQMALTELCWGGLHLYEVVEQMWMLCTPARYIFLKDIRQNAPFEYIKSS